MTNVYLVGVDHRIQWIQKDPSSDWKRFLSKFIDFIHEKCELLRIDLIAEEFSEYLLILNNAQASIVGRIAKERGIQHLFCDPNFEERQELGILNDTNREKEWLRRINETGNSRILFVCGDDHVESFQSLLIKADHNAEIVGKNFGIGWQMVN